MTGFLDALTDMFKPVRLKVLVADDSALQMSVLKKMLDELGHYPILAEKPEDVVGLAMDNRPDLIFLDMNMGRMSGIDVIERLKMDERLAKIPVAVCTFEQAGVTEKAAMRLGATAYLEKPLRIEALKKLLAPLEKEKRARP